MDRYIAFIGVKGIPANFAGAGGIETRVEKLAYQLVKQGLTVDVFVRDWATKNNLKKYQGISLIHLPTIDTKHFDAGLHSLLASIYVCFSKHKIIFYEAMGPAFFSFLPKLFGKKVITTIHCLDWKREKWTGLAKIFLKLGEKIALKISDKIIVVSDELQNYYQKQGIDTELFPTPVRKRGKILPKIIKQKYGFQTNDYLLYLGRFVPEKRIEWLIKAYQKTNCSKKLIIVGGSSHSQNYVAKIKKMADDNKNIIFPGYVFGKEKEELLANCFLFIQPSKLEGLSISLIEAIEYQRPVLVADIPSNKELIDNKNFLFKTNNFNDFYLHFINLINKKNIDPASNKNFLNKSWKVLAEKIMEITNL